MADKYIVMDTTGKEVWRLMAMTPGEACQVTADVKKVPLESLQAKIDVSYDPLAGTPKLPGEKKPRKTRVDKGQMHEKKRSAKRRTVYHLIKGGEVVSFEGKDKLDEYLNDNMGENGLGTAKVINGGTVHFVSCQKHYTLE